MKKIKVVSLFDGIRCAMVALERAGIEVESYYASEIDKNAIQIADKNYPNCINLGDINNWKYWAVDWSSIDLLVGGSPCQGFSFAGKQLNFEDPRSKLFFVYADILNHIRSLNPNVKFLLENVRMKQEFQDVITNIIGVKPIEINSALVSAQSRKRLYWTNIPDVSQPEDKGILLKNIVHEYNECVECKKPITDGEANYMLRGSEKWQQAGNCRLERYLQYQENKSFTLTANMYKGVPYNCFYEALNEYIVPFDKTLQILDKEVQSGKVGYFRKDSQANRVYYIHDKAVTLCGDAGGAQPKWGNTYLDVSPLTELIKDKMGKGLARVRNSIRLQLKTNMVSWLRDILEN